MLSHTRQIFIRTHDECDRILIARSLTQECGKRIQAAVVGRATQESLVVVLHQVAAALVAGHDRRSDLRVRHAVCEGLAERCLATRISRAFQRILIKCSEELGSTRLPRSGCSRR